jgi:TonB family protein
MLNVTTGVRGFVICSFLAGAFAAAKTPDFHLQTFGTPIRSTISPPSSAPFTRSNSAYCSNRFGAGRQWDPEKKGFSVNGIEPRGNADNWMSDEDNPGSFHGTVVARFHVASNGQVGDCRVIISSGNSMLDSLTCHLLSRRGKFCPPSERSTTGEYKHTW